MNKADKTDKIGVIVALISTAAALVALAAVGLILFRSLPVSEEPLAVESVSAAFAEEEPEESVPFAASEAPAQEDASAPEERVPGVEEALSLWTEGAPAKDALTDYLEAVTDPDSPDYIPPERRVAVFDLDGTLFCETDPNYFSYSLLVHRALEDEDYHASDFERETARKIVTWNQGGKKAKGLSQDHARALSSAFAGLTLEEYADYVRDFASEPAPGYTGMKRGGAWYQPMLQVVEALRAREFDLYLVTTTSRFVVRALVEDSPLDLPPSHVIGSDESLTALHQGDTPATDYVLGEEDPLVLEGVLLRKNSKMNKVTSIVREIGVQPVLCFGNSEGDVSMARYVTSGNPYRSMAVMLCCDDTERENGDRDKAEEMAQMCVRNGWVSVSMREDWSTIYGPNVTKK